MIEIKHLRKVFDDDTIPLKDIDVTINDGDVISIIGPSGTGKSTLLRCINMLTEPTSGSIIVDGQDITARGCNINEIRKKMGMVFQSFNLGYRKFPEHFHIIKIFNGYKNNQIIRPAKQGAAVKTGLIHYFRYGL